MANDETVSSTKADIKEMSDKNTPKTPPAEEAVTDAPDTSSPTNHSASTDTSASDNTSATESTTANHRDGFDTEPEDTPSKEELTNQLAEATQKAEKHWDSLLRKQAEYENLQKRMTRDLNNVRKYGLEKFATDLLAVKDSMELGLEAATQPETNIDSVRDGMNLTLKMLTDTMEKFNIVEINPQNEKFDPQWHEAMSMQPVPNVEANTVLHVQQKGYQLHERLLRPARVIVAKALEPEKNIENQG